jgi:hypothetical protein
MFYFSECCSLYFTTRNVIKIRVIPHDSKGANFIKIKSDDSVTVFKLDLNTVKYKGTGKKFVKFSFFIYK